MTIKKIDFERAAALMDIMQKVAAVSPMMMAISGEAGEELKAINEACKENARERAEEIRQKEQVVEQQRLQEVKAHDTENAKPRGPIQPPDVQPYMPGQPVAIPLGQPSSTDVNRDGVEDSQEPYTPTNEPIGRRL